MGSFLLVITMGLTGNPLAIGLILAALIYAGLHASGAHYNAAVSFAYFVQRKISFNTFTGYFLAQTLGAFAAAGVMLMLAGDAFYVEPPYSTGLYQQGTVELLMTFILVIAYLSMTGESSRKTPRLNGLAIGLTYAGAIYAGQVISGGLYNPSVSFGTSAVDFLAGGGASYSYIPMYTLAPITGAALAAYVYDYLRD